MDNRLLLTTGPAGVGKTMVLENLFSRNPELQTTVSHTTRSMRDHEVNGKQYHFVDPELFQKTISNGEFVEWADNHGKFYGTTHEELSRVMSLGHVVMDIDYKGARQIRAAGYDCKVIFLAPLAMSDLVEHMNIRGSEDEASRERRMVTAREEVLEAIRQPWYDYFLINQGEKESFMADFEELVLAITRNSSPDPSFSDLSLLQMHLATLL